MALERHGLIGEDDANSRPCLKCCRSAGQRCGDDCKNKCGNGAHMMVDQSTDDTVRIVAIHLPRITAMTRATMPCDAGDRRVYHTA